MVFHWGSFNCLEIFDDGEILREGLKDSLLVLIAVSASSSYVFSGNLSF